MSLESMSPTTPLGQDLTKPGCISECTKIAERATCEVVSIEDLKLKLSEGKIEVFDFDGRWSEVKPFLDDPLVQRALTAGMAAWCHFSTLDSIQDGGYQLSIWEPESGPWAQSGGPFWDEEIDKLAEDCDEYQAILAEMDDKPECEETLGKYMEFRTKFYPKPNTPDWYRCWFACHWLAAWNCVLGMKLRPDLRWLVCLGVDHSNAIGLGKRPLIMDILGSNWSPTVANEAAFKADWLEFDDQLAYLEAFAGIRTPESIVSSVDYESSVD